MIQDLHSHTYYSFCGADTPEEVVEAAINGGIELLGITDHNYGLRNHPIDTITIHHMAGNLSVKDGKSLKNALARLGIAHLEDRDISTLSDGEFQKACIAASLVQNAGVILLDEPTAFLDAENKTSVLHTLGCLCKDEASPAVIFSTHDLHEGMKACNKIIALGADGVFRISDIAGAEEAIKSIFIKRNIFQK